MFIDKILNYKAIHVFLVTVILMLLILPWVIYYLSFILSSTAMHILVFQIILVFCAIMGALISEFERPRFITLREFFNN